MDKTAESIQLIVACIGQSCFHDRVIVSVSTLPSQILAIRGWPR